MDQVITDIVKEGMADFHMRIKETIFSGVDPPNAPSTVAKKGFDAPLWETGKLFDAVSYKVETSPGLIHGEAGILDEDAELQKIAMINELGSITDPNHPPERSFVRAPYDANSERVLRKMEGSILDHLETFI